MRTSPSRVLVTGAAGFIGTAVVDELATRGHDVVGLDAWIPQAHGRDADPGDGRSHRVDVRDADAVAEMLRGVDVVCHQAAMVGAGVSAADLPLFASHNVLGTAVLLAAMAEAGVRRLVLASSMVVYGEGRYVCDRHGRQPSSPRRREDLAAGLFDQRCQHCDAAMTWEPIAEDAALTPRSGYAASKVAQEHWADAWTRQASAAAIALRYHNVYGPGMPADTPYSGVAAMFRSSLAHGESPRVFEDGRQMRDFVHVSDVAAANALAVEAVLSEPAETFESFNVCSGTPVSIGQVAGIIAGSTDRSGPGPVVTGEFRPGDVRHVVASPDKARAELGFAARVRPEQGLQDFAAAPLRG